MTFQYCWHIFQFSNLKWLYHQTSLSTWEIHKISFCLNNRYQMSQQVNYTSAACGLANSLCSTLLRLIGRPFAFDVLLFALQDRAEVLNSLSYAIASKITKNKASALATIVIKKNPNHKNQNQKKTPPRNKQTKNPKTPQKPRTNSPKQHVYYIFMAYFSNISSASNSQIKMSSTMLS